jgi:hypothetical protein
VRRRSEAQQLGCVVIARQADRRRLRLRPLPAAFEDPLQGATLVGAGLGLGFEAFDLAISLAASLRCSRAHKERRMRRTIEKCPSFGVLRPEAYSGGIRQNSPETSEQ